MPSVALFGELLLLLVHVGLLLVSLGLGARLGLLALLGALVDLRLALGLQCVIVGDVTNCLLDLALGFFHDAHVDLLSRSSSCRRVRVRKRSGLGPLSGPLLG